MNAPQHPNAPSPNAGAIEAWNTVLFDKFSRFRHVLEEGLGQHGDALFRRAPPRPGTRVLDVGCGFGESTQRIAELVGPAGEAVGVDCAARFVDEARRSAPRARFLEADVERDPLGGPYDDAYARFGTMFFASPVAALRNIRAALRPGGTLSMSVWRKREDNPCFHIAEQVVAGFVHEEDKADEVTCGPGPFSMASADLVSAQLLAAGFSEVRFERFDAPMCVGADLDEAVAFAREIGPAGEAIRLAAARVEGVMPAIEAALREAFRPHLRADGVWATSSTWLVRARA